MIAGNASQGVWVRADHATLEDNRIGVKETPAGLAALPNSEGVLVDFGIDDARIGGAGHGNVIAANGLDGVDLSGGQGHVVAANVIGAPGLANGGNGIIVNSTQTTIGGAAAGDANRVLSNRDNGVSINADGDTVQGNRVGEGPGTGHGDAGISLFGNNNQVLANVATNNGRAGIEVAGGTGNALVSNSTCANTGLGIDLDPAGITANDRGDGDTGANKLVNFPVVDNATANGGQTAITWQIERGLPNTTFQVEFFSAAACPAPPAVPAPVRNAEAPLGTVTVTTNANGNTTDANRNPGPVTTTVPFAVAPGQIVTATATQVLSTSPLTLGSTSELADCQLV